MDNRDIILHCLYENWPDEVSMIGDDSVTQIVDDTLEGHRPELRPGRGGFNFDLAPHIATIIAGTSLVVSLIELIYIMLPPRGTPGGDTPGDTSDRTEEDPARITEEDLARILAQFLMGRRNVEPSDATELARVLIRIIIRICSNGH